jgi:hypothetical protein
MKKVPPIPWKKFESDRTAMLRELEREFPNIGRSGVFRPTSPIDPRYNCIAYAAGRTDVWYWPGSIGWPHELPSKINCASLQSLFTDLLDFEITTDDKFEVGYKKVCLFKDQSSMPTHASFLVEKGVWKSKFGRFINALHSLSDLEEGAYGEPYVFLRKRSSTL